MIINVIVGLFALCFIGVFWYLLYGTESKFIVLLTALADWSTKFLTKDQLKFYKEKMEFLAQISKSDDKDEQEKMALISKTVEEIVQEIGWKTIEAHGKFFWEFIKLKMMMDFIDLSEENKDLRKENQGLRKMRGSPIPELGRVDYTKMAIFYDFLGKTEIDGVKYVFLRDMFGDIKIVIADKDYDFPDKPFYVSKTRPAHFTTEDELYKRTSENVRTPPQVQPDIQ